MPALHWLKMIQSSLIKGLTLHHIELLLLRIFLNLVTETLSVTYKNRDIVKPKA